MHYILCLTLVWLQYLSSGSLAAVLQPGLSDGGSNDTFTNGNDTMANGTITNLDGDIVDLYPLDNSDGETRGRRLSENTPGADAWFIEIAANRQRAVDGNYLYSLQSDVNIFDVQEVLRFCAGLDQSDDPQTRDVYSVDNNGTYTVLVNSYGISTITYRRIGSVCAGFLKYHRNHANAAPTTLTATLQFINCTKFADVVIVPRTPVFYYDAAITINTTEIRVANPIPLHFNGNNNNKRDAVDATPNSQLEKRQQGGQIPGTRLFLALQRGPSRILNHIIIVVIKRAIDQMHVEQANRFHSWRFNPFENPYSPESFGLQTINAEVLSRGEMDAVLNAVKSTVEFVLQGLPRDFHTDTESFIGRITDQTGQLIAQLSLGEALGGPIGVNVCGSYVAKYIGVQNPGGDIMAGCVVAD